MIVLLIVMSVISFSMCLPSPFLGSRWCHNKLPSYDFNDAHDRLEMEYRELSNVLLIYDMIKRLQDSSFAQYKIYCARKILY